MTSWDNNWYWLQFLLLVILIAIGRHLWNKYR